MVEIRISKKELQRTRNAEEIFMNGIKLTTDGFGLVGNGVTVLRTGNFTRSELDIDGLQTG